MENTKVATRMELCRDCLDLRGPFYDTFNKCERVQRCGCEPKDPPWNAFDYNTAAELCHCCAAVVIASGSRWNLFYCDACKERVVAYDRAAGAALIPIGRHSIMNNFSLPANEAHRPRARATFARKLVGMGHGIERLGKYHLAHVRRVVSGIAGAEYAIPIAAYLEHARSLLPTAEAAFEELLRAI
jgi:hypothetical protein